MSQDPTFSTEAPRILSPADPALMITEEELIRSRERSLSFMDSDVTHIAVGGSIHDFHRAPAKRPWGRLAVAGLGAAAAVAASVLVASAFGTVPADMAAAPPVSDSTPLQSPPAGPLRDLFFAADEVLVLQALPNTDAWQQEYKSFMSQLGQAGGPAYGPPGLGVEPVNVLQVLKGTRSTGRSTLDVSAMPDANQWKNTNTVAPLTYLAFIKKGPDGIGHLMSEPQALLQILNLRSATVGDPVKQQPVDIGADLRSRIAVAPTGDVPLSTYAAAPPVAEGKDRTSEGTVHGHITASEACFTFQTSAEKVVLRWPAGYTAATRSLPQDSNGSFRIDGASHADRAVVLNEWGTVYAFDTWTLPQISGNRAGEKAACGGQTLPVFDITPPGEGASPFRLTHGAAGPSPQL
ncbi:hypothetical protein [Arthrobacter sp. ISL-69]|uniref:hypothetical protein n=1 Tax=Arthrobacter sp. ISL-69 TaxID=2819113 RepID=UPI001BEB4F96|nr:hypothetical protein [Arthrobacter sp. ISL-69]MBT2538789.1 hypothetical protein [Arthrobacter sp. ISL-69]